jgi:hypothetical protein
MSDVNGTVVAIQGRDVDSAAPNDGDTFRWNASTSKWEPVAPPQPLEPWVGSVDTQSQIIKRIPWTCRAEVSSSVWYSTGVSVTVPTDKAVGMFIYGVFRKASSVAGVNATAAVLSIANNGGTLTTPPSETGMGSNVSGTPAPANPAFRLVTSGTVVTLEISFFNPGAPPGIFVDCQGYVDLIIN